MEEAWGRLREERWEDQIPTTSLPGGQSGNRNSPSESLAAFPRLAPLAVSRVSPGRGEREGPPLPCPFIHSSSAVSPALR